MTKIVNRNFKDKFMYLNLSFIAAKDKSITNIFPC